MSGFTEMVAIPERGRLFTGAARVGLADCSPSGRIRLDALARWLQDVAYADVDDAGVADAAVWVVRRTRIRVVRFPRFGERCTLRTFCSGFGRAWAERRTIISRDGEDRSAVEAVALWVHLDPVTRRPSPPTSREVEVYGGAAAGRRVNARLRHPAAGGAGVGPGAGGADSSRRWTFRATERDLAEHINNAAYWEPLEEDLLAGEEPDAIDVEIEFRTPAQPGEKLVVRDGSRWWIVSEDGETHASALVARPGSGF